LVICCFTEKVAKEAEGEIAGWTVKLIIFVGGTCGSVLVQTFNNNLKELGVVESKRNAIRKEFVHELLNAQDTVLCSYFAQRSGTKGNSCCQKTMWKKFFKDWIDLNKTWWKTVRRNMDRKTMCGKYKRAS
jgi:hypothetical protein